MRVLSDKQLVQNLQQGHGGWNESMTEVRNFSLDFLVICNYIIFIVLRKTRLIESTFIHLPCSRFLYE